jgi:hypothetical protein
MSEQNPWNLRANINEETQTFASVICSNVIYTVDEKSEESFHGKPWAKWTMNYLSRLHDSHHGALGTIGRSFFFYEERHRQKATYLATSCRRMKC